MHGKYVATYFTIFIISPLTTLRPKVLNFYLTIFIFYEKYAAIIVCQGHEPVYTYICMWGRISWAIKLKKKTREEKGKERKEWR